MDTNTLPDLAKIPFLFLFYILSISAIRYKFARPLLYLLMIFLVAFDLGLSLSLTPFRLAAAAGFVAMVTDYKELFKLLIRFRENKLILALVGLPIYMTISAFLSHSTYEIYFRAEWLIIILATATFYYSASKRMLKYSTYLIIVAFAINLYNWFPRNIEIFGSLPEILKGTPYHFYASRFGAFLVPFIALPYIREKNPSKRIVLLLSLILVITGTFLTGGRAQFVATLVIMGIVLRKQALSVLFLSILMITILFVTNTISFNTVFGRYMSLTVTQSETPAEIAFREENILIAYNGFKESPILGQGLSAWYQYSNQYVSRHLAVHNSYLYVLFSLGLIGSFLFSLAIFKSLRPREFASNTDKYYNDGNYKAFMLIVALLIMGIAHTIILLTYYAPFFLGMRAGYICRLSISK